MTREREREMDKNVDDDNKEIDRSVDFIYMCRSHPIQKERKKKKANDDDDDKKFSNVFQYLYSGFSYIHTE